MGLQVAHILHPMKGGPGEQEPCCCIFHSVYTTLLDFVNIEPLATCNNELEIHGNIIAFFFSLQSLHCQS